jgi:hypothetical protein
MKKASLTIISIFISFTAFAQYDYEPSVTLPFGKPNPKAPEQIIDFQPMIGECNCKSVTRNQDGTWAEPIDMIWRFKYIMNGFAVQDETLKTDGTYAGSIRQFSTDSSKWYVHYYTSKLPRQTLSTWEGNKIDDKIILYKEQKAPNGTEGFYKITFYDMTENGYKWIGEWVNKDESIIYPTWKIECTKE